MAKYTQPQGADQKGVVASAIHAKQTSTGVVVNNGALAAGEAIFLAAPDSHS